MDKIYNFMNEYRNTIVLVIILILIFLTWFYLVPFLRKRFEFIENVTSISSLADKNVYVSCDLGYLAIADKKDCHNLKDIVIGECGFNVPILQKQKNKFTLFKLEKHPTQNRYALRSQVESLNMPYLTQNLNYYKDVTYMCFDNNIDDEIIFFEVEENNLGIILKFRKKIAGAYKYFYLGLCSDLGLKCMQGSNEYKRLCLYGDIKNALPFKFEISPQQNKSTDEIYKEVIEAEHKKNKVSSEGMEMKKEHFENDLYSLEGSEGSSLNNSLPGFDYSDNIHEIF